MLKCRPLFCACLASVGVAGAVRAAAPQGVHPQRPRHLPRKPRFVAVMEKMADAQLAEPAYRNGAPADWVAGAFYVGLAAAGACVGEPAFFGGGEAVAEKNAWEFKGVPAGPRTSRWRTMNHRADVY